MIDSLIPFLWPIAGSFCAAVSTLFIYVWNRHVSRTDQLEQMLDQKMTRQEVRELLEDKLEPIKENLNDAKDKLDQVYMLLLKK